MTPSVSKPASNSASPPIRTGLSPNRATSIPAGTSNSRMPTPRKNTIHAANAALAPSDSTYSGNKIVSASWLTAISSDGT